MCAKAWCQEALFGAKTTESQLVPESVLVPWGDNCRWHDIAREPIDAGQRPQ